MMIDRIRSMLSSWPCLLSRVSCLFSFLPCLTVKLQFVFVLIVKLCLAKATGAYMPLELVYPADLLEGVMKQVKPPVVLTQVSYIGFV